MSKAMSSSARDSQHADASTRRDGRRPGSVPDSRELTAVQQAVVQGALRKALGFEMEDLRYGLRLAADRMRRGAFAEALQIYIALVLCEPMHAEFQLGLANCALQLGENHLAVQAASVVIAAEPENFKAYYISGRASLALRQREEAEEDLSKAFALAEKAKAVKLATEIAALLRRLRAIKGSGSG